MDSEGDLLVTLELKSRGEIRVGRWCKEFIRLEEDVAFLIVARGFGLISRVFCKRRNFGALFPGLRVLFIELASFIVKELLALLRESLRCLGQEILEVPSHSTLVVMAHGRREVGEVVVGRGHKHKARLFNLFFKRFFSV